MSPLQTTMAPDRMPRVGQASTRGAKTLLAERLREAMVRAGFVHPDGQPNKRRFAHALNDTSRENNPDKWERYVYAWTSEEDPRGLSDESAELAAEVLKIDPDYLRLEALVPDLEQRGRRNADALADLAPRVERIEAQLLEVQAVLERLTNHILGPRPEH